VSRQLWWGHRIPAYRVARRQGGGGSGGGSEAGGGEADQGGWVVARTREEAEAKLGSVDLEQDPDVLDTWFSSGLLPLSVNGWPRRPPAHTYPLSLMETGADILFFWVARMVMLCSHLSAAAAGPPFPHVYLHAMVRDKHGRKMSKSLGNVLDPSHVIEGVSAPHMLAALRAGNLDPRELARAEADVRADFPEGIPRLGTDALRLALASYSPASPVLFDVDRAAQARLFCNKMWQAVRFAKDFSPDRGGGSSSHAHEVSLEARWVRHRAAETAAACRAAYQDLNLSAASGAARRFFVADLCDVFLEACKSRRTADNALALRQCTSHALVMLHPVAPLITETLFEHLNGQVCRVPPPA
jgi:valyl-tRNA synthetase